METPTLTKNQQKLAMSAKKKKETVKNVLVTSYKNYWPLLSKMHVEELHDTLKENLPLLKHKKVNIPWNDVKDIPKSERKNFRWNYTSNQLLNDENKHIKSQMLFGVNEITRALEKDNVHCILITKDPPQQIIVKHLIDMAVLRRVPIIIAINLQEAIYEYTGIQSLALAFKNNISNGKLILIVNEIKDLSTKYPVPKGHINYARSLNNNNISDEVVKSRTVLFKDTVDSMSACVVDDDSATKQNNILINDKTDGLDKYHLYRSSKKERIFVPKVSCEAMNVDDKPMKEIGDFLKFSDEDLVKETVNRYKPLKVNRVRSNKNRIKEKAANLKRKR